MFKVWRSGARPRIRVCGGERANPSLRVTRVTGGYGSGRSGGRPTVESDLTLDLYRLIRQGLFKPGQYRSGSIVWTRVSTGELTASMGYEAHMGIDNGHLRLRYTTTRYGGEKRDSDYSIMLVTTPQPFGGRRWWFRCPRTADFVSKLHLPNGAYTFASRRAYRLGYPCQRESPRDRSFSRAFALRRKISGEGGIGDYIPKPKGMHRRTFERAMEKVFEAEEIADAHLALALDRMRRLPSAGGSGV
jgi:hypothetical protein